jgi:hypothetical protein
MRAAIAVGLAVSAVSFSAALARAEPTICEVRSTDPVMGLFDVHCGPPHACASADDCSETGFETPVCGTALEDLPDICRPHCGTLVGCDGDGDCRRFRDAVGSCHLTSTAAGGIGVCAYPALGASYCVAVGEALDPMRFARCHTRPDGTATSNYFEGNCDGDGCPNGGDNLPCVNDRTPCLTLDTTVACSTSPIDGGVFPLDAGVVVTPDAGGLDAGPETDAGVVEPFDAYVPPASSFGGGGGVRCTCRTARTPASHGVMALSVGLVLATLARRRSR